VRLLRDEPLTDAEDVDDGARRSTALEWAVRIGLTAYALLHLAVAWVAIRLVFPGSGSGGGSGSATGSGALASFADDTLGKFTLLAMSAGFAALVVWQGLTAAVGYRDRDGAKRHLLRAGAGCRTVVYGYLGVSAARLALEGPSGKGRSPQSMTAELMHAPAGSYLVLGIGLVVAGIGIGQIVFGLTRGFLDQLDDKARNGDRRLPIVLIGQVGYVVKGVAFVAVGTILGWAALSHEPRKTGGLDQALQQLVDGGLGRPAVILVGAGIGIFGVYALLWSRHLDDDSLTS
jgi:hypothetical protein